MKRGAGRKEFDAAFEARLLPAVNRFRPELVIISAGFDARQGDPLGKLELTDQDFSDLTAVLLAIAREHAGGKLVSVLEGGYSLTGLASAATAHCGALQRA
jgi:acetoin utilization deacetylase AcuC-like enzyme